jgi:AraC-like DNA-binding protein
VRIELESELGHEVLAEGRAGALPSMERRAWPAPIGTGTFGFIDIRPGIVLCITDLLPITDIRMIGGPGIGYFTCSYYLDGRMDVVVEGITEPIRIREGQRCTGFAAPGCGTAGFFAGGRRNVIVSLCLTPEAAVELLPRDETRRVAAWHDAIAHGHSLGEVPRPLGEAQRTTVVHLLTCPFAGTARRLFLESKVLELLAYEAADADSLPHIPLSTDDEQRIRHAAGILTARLDEPPTLAGLARMVGINELKLKRGFHAVFGTTVFGYLRARRLEVARALLLGRTVSVAEAADRVGYRCPSRFASAFRRHFGASPSSLRQQATHAAGRTV